MCLDIETRGSHTDKRKICNERKKNYILVNINFIKEYLSINLYYKKLSKIYKNLKCLQPKKVRFLIIEQYIKTIKV